MERYGMEADLWRFSIEAFIELKVEPKNTTWK